MIDRTGNQNNNMAQNIALRSKYWWQVLLELTDLELECGLGITHPMHRKKLRLAIEEHRHPTLVRYPCIAQLGHTWVSSEWLPDLGLAQVKSADDKHTNSYL